MFFDAFFNKNRRPLLVTLAFLLLTTILIIVMFYRNSITIKLDQITLLDNPSAAAKETETIDKGTRLSIVNQQHGWYQLRREDNEKSGWVPSWIVNDQSKWADKKITRLSRATIVLDAGHGGSDPGSIAVVGQDKNVNYQEKTYTLKMVQAIQKELEKTGARVILTRDSDTFVNIHKIPTLAIENKADVFISIHFDSTDPVPLRKSDDDQSENSDDETTINSEESDSSTDQADDQENQDSDDDQQNLVPASGFETFYYHNDGSKELSQTLNDALSGLGLNNRGSNKAEYVVLKENSQPATLLELGFINNGDDFKLIKSEQYRINVSKRIRKGLTNYFDQVAPKLSYPTVQNSK